MIDHRNETHTIFCVLMVFVIAWLGTEIYESYRRGHYQSEVKDFMQQGARFTAEDGAALEERIERLEQKVLDDEK